LPVREHEKTAEPIWLGGRASVNSQNRVKAASERDFPANCGLFAIERMRVGVLKRLLEGEDQSWNVARLKR
jgi:hypothetical protein